MITIKKIPKVSFELLFASTKFWFCNIIGWLVFDIAQSFRDSFDGSPVIVNMIKYAPMILLGIFTGLCVHCFYKKRQWQKQHPIQLIPIAGLIALVFASLSVFISLFDLAISLPEICYHQYSRTPNYCGVTTNLFLQSFGVMLVWCLFYFLIQAEQKTLQEIKFSIWDLTKAIIILLGFYQLDTMLSSIAYLEWGNTYYLFSKAYFLSFISNIVFTILFASYAYFIKPGERFFGSQILPLIPTLCVISLCCTVLTIGASSAIWRLYYFCVNHPLSHIHIYYVMFGQTYGGFNSKDQLAGTLQGGFTNTLIMALFFLSCCNSIDGNGKHTITPNLDMKKFLLFWSYNFFFWLSFGLIFYATDLMDLTQIGKSVPLISTISFTGIGIFIGAILRTQIHYFATRRTTPIALVFKISFSSIFMGTLLTSTLWLINYAYILVVLDGYEIEHYKDFVSNNNYVFASILASCVLCGLWAFICHMIESQHLQRDATIKQLQIERNMKEVQLNTLAGKIDPHFVFNALNNIRALVDEDSEKARSALVVLSEILRSPITNNSHNKISLAEEMALVRNYIALSKIQLEDRLIYSEKVSEDANTALIPSMMLQILVENAIKHGISQLPDGGVLSLHAYICKQQLVCKITNHGSLLLNSPTSGFGVGLNAIQERLALLYNTNANFNLQETNNTVIAELILPFETTV